MRIALLPLLTVLSLGASCGAPAGAFEESEGEATLVTDHSGVRLVLAPSRAACVEFQGLGAAGTDEVVLHSDDSTRPVKVFLYEKSGDREGYGVYGLEGFKNDFAVAWPLEPDTIDWDDVGPRGALERQLNLVGAPDAAAFIEAESAWLWAPGARVVFLLEAPWEDSEAGRRGPLVVSHPLR